MEKISVGKIDPNGFLIDVYLGTKTDDGQVEIDGIILDKTEYVENVGEAVSKVKAKWTGSEWAEGATKKEIEEYEANLEKELYPNGRPESLLPQKTMAEMEEDLQTATERVDMAEAAAMELFEQNLQLQNTIAEQENRISLTEQGLMEVFESVVGGAK